jgi:hypothetical protein
MAHIYNFKGSNIHIAFKLIKRHYEPRIDVFILYIVLFRFDRRFGQNLFQYIFKERFEKKKIKVTFRLRAA